MTQTIGEGSEPPPLHKDQCTYLAPDHAAWVRPPPVIWGAHLW
eukprot:CAMPEP_0181237786 /NCGR_PEP_ID=MMETSP1096-20121128/38962_1 /TAXON_ID=156174 ORGANISM="Chrysochromulina ericina, Strain CCMP281" /NCGR_SAMPLE_ID=MMETSP1096 /ASSEMBLY_ACC=CAM_ASM_000453 /LENGTH=42 /DNA_ID= /DNA_START= /DNA_END= /DNA_ORIENTATION=